MTQAVSSQAEKKFGKNGDDGFWCVRETNDGGLILTGFTSSFGLGAEDVWIIKTNSTGEEKWNRTFGFQNGKDGGEFVRQTSDGGYIIGGHTGTHHYARDILLIKTDECGKTLYDF